MMQAARLDGMLRKPSDAPNSLEAEQGVISCLVLDPSLWDDVASLVCPESFFDVPCRMIFEAMARVRLANSSFDVTLLVTDLKERNELETVGGVAKLMAIFELHPSTAHVAHYARLVRDFALRRRLAIIGGDITQLARDSKTPIDDVTSRSETMVLALRDEELSDGAVTADRVIHDRMDELERRMSGDIPPGLPTGFNELDGLLGGGLRTKKMIILAARPSMGKTAFAANIAENACRRGDSVLFASLEMDRGELTDRMLCTIARVDSLEYFQGNLSSDEKRRVVRAAELIYDWPLTFVDSPKMSVADIASHARRTKRKQGLKLIVVDYLQLLQPVDPREFRERQVARMSADLKEVARELDVPVLCLAQLSRKGEERKNPTPILSDLRESGGIEQDADVVMFIHRPEYYWTEKQKRDPSEQSWRGIATIMLAKQRAGKRNVSSNLEFHETYTRFDNIDGGYMSEEFE